MIDMRCRAVFIDDYLKEAYSFPYDLVIILCDQVSHGMYKARMMVYLSVVYPRLRPLQGY
jgi:hypothetical protein